MLLGGILVSVEYPSNATRIESGSSPPNAAVAWLAIWGMYCPECQARVKDALQRLPGVVDVEVDWIYMGARVVFAPEQVGINDLIACVGGVDTHAEYHFWAASGPEVSRAVRETWKLRCLRTRTNGQPSSSKVQAR